MNTETLKGHALEWRFKHQRSQRYWSGIHHASVFGAILCSVLAGALLQVPEMDFKGASTVLTTMAAALASLGAAGGFQRKWQSNRLSRSRVDCLLLDLDGSSPDLEALSGRLKQIIERHDLNVVTDAGVEVASNKSTNDAVRK